MTKAQIIFTHRRLANAITMEVETDLLHRALRRHDSEAQGMLVGMVQKQHSLEHGDVLAFLSWHGLGICETEESLLRRDPQANFANFPFWASLVKQLTTRPAS